MTNADVTKHAEAMRAIADAVGRFPPEEQMVLLAGELGNALCRVGPEPSRLTAIMMMGSAIQMIVDMIERQFPKERFDA